MNSEIQKFDIGLMMQEKFDELTRVRGMSDDAARQLIAEAVSEWEAVNRPDERRPQPTSCGRMKAYLNLQTHHISREPEREPRNDECQFDDVTAAAIYLSDLERPMLERMRAGGLGDKR